MNEDRSIQDVNEEINGDKEFAEGIEELMVDEERLYNSMARDLYGLGRVLFKKYELLKQAYNIFMFGIVIAVLLFIGVFLTVS